MNKNQTKQKELTTKSQRPTVLRFNPTAWAKLLYLRDAGDTEIGGFGIARSDDLLFVEDVQLVSQTCTWAHVRFDDEAVANFFDQQVDAGRRPEEFGRVWIHTHPGQSPAPSGTDEQTFARVFGSAHWAVMLILARGGQTYARLRYNIGPGAELQLPVEVDYRRSFAGSNSDAWQQEYTAHVRAPLPPPNKIQKHPAPLFGEDALEDDWWQDTWGEYVDFEHNVQKGEYGYLRDF